MVYIIRSFQPFRKACRKAFCEPVRKAFRKAFPKAFRKAQRNPPRSCWVAGTRGANEPMPKPLRKPSPKTLRKALRLVGHTSSKNKEDGVIRM